MAGVDDTRRVLPIGNLKTRPQDYRTRWRNGELVPYPGKIWLETRSLICTWRAPGVTFSGRSVKCE